VADRSSSIAQRRVAPVLAVKRAVGALLACALLSCSAGCEEREASTRKKSPPNVVLFVLDAARADHIGSYGYPRDTTPHIDRLAERGTLYRQAISDASYTFASVAALFTGQPPDESGILAREPLGEERLLIAESAQEHGFRTYAYSENPYVTGTFGLSQGFEEADEALSLPAIIAARGHIPEVDSEARIAKAIAFAREPDERPFFLYVHVLRPHNPYSPPKGFPRKFSEGVDAKLGTTENLTQVDVGKLPLTPALAQRLIALYDDNLRYGDALFGILHQALADSGLLANTVVIVASDHGEAFKEHGRMLHSTTVFEEMIRVPLIVALPDSPPASRDGPVLLSTLGRALRAFFEGEERGLETLTHLDQAPHSTATPIVWSVPGNRRAGIRAGNLKLIANTKARSAIGLFDLSTDPGERVPLDRPAETQHLLGRLQSIANGEPAAPIDPRMQEQLRALGYTPD
jgi:arylsulfatase A-like enzyme